MKRGTVLCALLFVSAPGIADTVDVVKWTGTRDRVIERNQKAIDIPVDLATTLAPDSPAVIQITTSGREMNASAVRATFVRIQMQSYLRLTFNDKDLTRSGAYLVKIRVPAPIQTPPAFKDSLLELTLTQPAAELAFQTPLRTERVIYFCDIDCWYPKRWPLHEVSGAQSVTPTASSWIASFSGTDQKALGAKLKFELPASIAPGRQADVVLTKTSSFPLGTSNGKLTISAPQLAKPFEQAIEVVTRVSRIWLFITIVISILLGHYTRITLEKRRLRAAAIAAAGEQLKELNRLIRITVDDDFRIKYESEARALETAVTNSQSDLAAATTAAKGAAASISARIADAQKNSSARIVELKTAIGNPAAQSGPLRAKTAAIVRLLDDAQKNLAAGQISEADRALEELSQSLPEDLNNARLEWMTFVRGVVVDVGAWPDLVKGAQKLGAVQTAAAAVPKVTSATDEGAMLAAAASVTRDLREALLVDFVSGARDIAANLQKELDPLRAVGDIGARLDALTVSTDAVDRAIAEDIDVLAKAVGALRAAIVAALTAVVPNNVPPSIAEGRFATAIAEVLALKKGQDKALGDATPFLESIEQARSNAAGSTDVPALMHATIEADDESIIGRITRLHLIVADATPAATISIDWYAGDQLVKRGSAGDLTFRFRPSVGEPVVIRAEIAAGERHGTTSHRLEPRPPIVIDTAANQKLGEKAARKQTAINGIFIVAIGWLIFGKGFVGSPEDFVAAALWGYFVDITLPRLQEYAAPITGRTPTFP
ncbi:MAG TPA: hypothetical protein VMU84_09295 [Thermoanaerobaculia bacterium]|nr:hypothetical protein [Thermoanaerobaculia bacterium]